ncbi:MAG: hypothetical protein V4446_10260, partial [Pseudomonadota bacterium]
GSTGQFRLQVVHERQRNPSWPVDSDGVPHVGHAKPGDPAQLLCDRGHFKQFAQFGQGLGGTGKFNYVSESAYQITLKNAKNQPVVVNVFEPMPGDWQILSESSPHSKESASTAQWKISVPADGKAVLTYRVRVKY